MLEKLLPIASFFLLIFHSQSSAIQNKVSDTTVLTWEHQCIDSMKSSRDHARDWAKKNNLVQLIDEQLTTIKAIGANCVAIDTPYDDEFIPYLTAWVNEAHRLGLSVWFRGNFSSWEQWFSYPKMVNFKDHNLKTARFITLHPDLFENGDLFSPLPESENGGPGDPRHTGKSQEYLAFLISSYDNCQSAFLQIGKKVKCGYYSTNGDIAKKILTSDTAQKIGNVVTIDHYVDSESTYENDLKFLFQKFSSPLFIGEFGAPIPDLNGNLSEEQQSEFIDSLLHLFYINREKIIGVNYWVLTDGTTALLNTDGSRRQVADTLQSYFRPSLISGSVRDPFGNSLSHATIQTSNGIATSSNTKGEFQLTVPAKTTTISIAAPNFSEQTLTIDAKQNKKYEYKIVLQYQFANKLFSRYTAILNRIFRRN